MQQIIFTKHIYFLIESDFYEESFLEFNVKVISPI